MSNIYEVFNVTNDYELSKVFDKLDLSYNEMTNIDYIVESMNKENARNKILEIMAGSADGNYEVCLEQFAKTIKKRVLKEESGLNLNQIMELNQLVELVASKLSANQQQCLEGIYNIISQKAGVNAAKTFIGMVQQSSVNQSSLKFNTDLVVDGKNLAQVIYALKNEIEIFCNSIKKEESEKEEVKESVDGYSIENRLAGVYNIKNGSFRELANGEQHNLSEQDFKNRLVRYGFQDTEDGKVCYITAWSYADAFNTRRALTKKYPNENVEKWRLEWFQNGDGSWNRPLKKYVEIIGKDGQTLNESYESYKHIIQELDKAVDDVSDINVLKSIAERVNTLLGKVKNMNEANEIASLKTTIETKMNSLMDVKPQLEECCLATQVAQDVCGEDTFNGLLDSVKPTVINITVNKEDNGILPCLDNCCDVPCCDVPCNDCENTDIAPIVQPMNFEPTAIDAPILRKPNSAEVTSAITALSSHTNDIKSDSRENNLENLQTINTLLGQISNYFNTLLGESFNIGDKITNKKGINDEVMEITDKYEKDGREVYDVKVDLGNGIKTVSKGLDAKDLEDKNEKIESLWDGEEDDLEESVKSYAIQLNENSTDFMGMCIADDLRKKGIEINKNQDDESIIETIDEIMKEYNADSIEAITAYNYLTNTKFYDISEIWENHNNKELDEEKTLPSGDYTIVAYDIVVDEYFEGEYNIHEKKVLKIHHNSNTSLDEEIKEAILEDMGESYNGSIKVVDYEYQIVDKVADEQLDEETVYDHSWFEVEGQKYPKRTKNGVEGLPIKEMSNFEEFDSLIVENYRQYAGILDLNDNSLFYLPQGAIHHNYIKESDVFNGKVRFGVAEYRGKVVGYISSDSREHMMKALKILKRELSSAPISYWMVEYFEDGQRVRMNIDDNGRTVYENKNDWFPAWGNVKKLVETCSAGACCAASVATVPSKPKKVKSKPRKQESFDVSLFKESVRNDCPVTLTINDKMVSYKLVEGKGYLYIDNGIVKTLDKDVMLETIDDVYNNCLDIDVLEGYNAYELNILLEDELNSDMGDVDSVTTITPDEKKKAQTELDNNLSQKPNAKINVVSSENNGEIHQNQEFIGIDDHDESNKKYIVKDPATGKITVADYNQIKIAEN